MSPVSDPANHPAIAPRLKLDTSAFQRLLAAAWAIQCQRDAELRGETPPKSRTALIPESFFEPADSPVPEHIWTKGVSDGKADAPAVSLPAKLPPQSIHRSIETSGALALASDLHVLPARWSPSVPKSAGVAVRNAPLPDATQSRTSLSLVTLRHSQQLNPVKIRVHDFKLAAVLGASILVVAAIAAGIGLRLRSHRTTPLPYPVSSAAVQQTPQERTPLFESSHRRVTDDDTSAALGDMSRYEMRSLRRQANFGDDEAALLLGMTYELGNGVPQDCHQAAAWIHTAAQNGNASAQYNLALRYISGDGVLANKAEAYKWLRQSAQQGYQKAADTLRRSVQ